MTASLDTYGTVYVGFNGNSFVYGTTRTSVPATNYVLNPSFDADNANTSNPANWPAWQPAGQPNAAYTESYVGTKSGARHYTHWNPNAYFVNTYQNISNLPNGTYTLSCWAKSSGGQNGVYIAASGYGGAYVSKTVPASPNAYVQVTLTGIQVTNGFCQINLTSDAKAGNWAYFDDVTLTKN
jgi:arabinogalactan endo-1,4-beta-galactosidase